METVTSDNKKVKSNQKSDKVGSNMSMRPIPYLPHTNEDRQDILDFLGISSTEDLLKNIPKELRNFELNIPTGKSELEVLNKFKKLAAKNKSPNNQISFCGGGVYNRFIPSVVNEILGRGEFYSAYTPYQPEASQGTLQAIYEFQTLICNLTGMDSTNASVYDGQNAIVEAALMACRITKRKKILISKTVNPEARKICKTYAWGSKLDLEVVEFSEGITDLNELEKLIDEDTACFITANPNYLGCIEPLDKISEIVHSKKSLLISYVDLISLALLKTPKELGVDIAVGDGQQLGNFSNYGGPHVGFISCLKAHVRQLPGRLVGLSKDKNGDRAFTLTLQTREQHIRREHATSNICTNQSLNALATLVYLTYMGPYGLKKIAEISLNRAHFLASEIEKASGGKIKLPYKAPYFNEFVLELPISAKEFIEKMTIKNILPGLDLNERDGYKNNHILVSVTEVNDKEQLDTFINCLNKIF